MQLYLSNPESRSKPRQSVKHRNAVQTNKQTNKQTGVKGFFGLKNL